MHFEKKMFAFTDSIHEYIYAYIRISCKHGIHVISVKKKKVTERPGATGIRKEDIKRKNILPSLEKRCASVVYSLCTYFIRSTRIHTL